MTKQMLSPLTGKLTIYYEHSALMSFQLADPVPPESLRTLMNSNLLDAGYDATVDEVKIIQTALDTNVQAHIWIAEQSPVGPWLALAILAICVTVCYIWYQSTSTAQTIVEHFWPKAKFYQVDVEGNQIVVGSLAEYITCQRAAHPDEFVCGWCGQVYPTEELRDAHEETCPWKDGVPGEPPPYPGLIVLGLGVMVVIAGIWLVGKLFARS